ncbi:MAG: arylsulfotransferase family protein [Solirubrobacterales bacterium]
MKLIRALIPALAALALLPASADARRPSFEIAGGDPFPSAFSWKARDYVDSCPAGTLRLEVDGGKGWRARVSGRRGVGGDFRTRIRRGAGQGVDLTFRRKRDGMARHFHVRCLPGDFPGLSFDRRRRGGAKLFMVQLPEDYAAIFNRDGVPVWWMQASNGPGDAKVLPDGTISWDAVEGGATVTGAFDIRSLSGRLIRTIGDDDTTDVHDIQLLPNGNYVIGEQDYRTGVDTTAFGGVPDAALLVYEIREVTPGGDVVRSWSTAEHIGLGETGRWWPEVASSLIYDTSHWNAVEIDGRYMYLSFRHLDAIYKVDRRTGEIVWKLGGTETPESLEVLNDPHPHPLGGQHDVRVLPNGTITVHDNRTGLAAEAPRAERYRIDEEAGTAKLVESVGDRGIDSARCCGSARRLPDRSWLVSWGQNPVVGAYDGDGRPIYRLSIDGSFSYRANPVTAVGTRDLRRGMDRMHP